MQKKEKKKHEEKQTPIGCDGTAIFSPPPPPPPLGIFSCSILIDRLLVWLSTRWNTRILKQWKRRRDCTDSLPSIIKLCSFQDVSLSTSLAFLRVLNLKKKRLYVFKLSGLLWLLISSILILHFLLDNSKSWCIFSPFQWIQCGFLGFLEFFRRKINHW